MGSNFHRFIDLLLLLLFNFQSKATVFIRNQQVKAGFKKESSIKSVLLLAGVITGFFLLLWILINSLPLSEKKENTINPSSLENQQKIQSPNSIIKIPETDTEALKQMDLTSFAKKDNEENVAKEEVKIKNDKENIVKERVEIKDSEYSMLKEELEIKESEESIAKERIEIKENEEKAVKKIAEIKNDEENVVKEEIEIKGSEDSMVKEGIEMKDEEEVKEENKEDEGNVNITNAVVTTPHYMRVIANNVNIRDKSSRESDIIARLGQGYMVKKMDKKGDWIFADSGEGFKGWIYYDLLEDTTEDEYKSWKNNPNISSVIGLIRKDLDDAGNLQTEKIKIEQLLRSWKTAWEEKDIDKYMAFYSKAFTKSTFNWEGYKEYKKNIFNRPGTISIEIKNIKITWDSFFIVASFNQKYQSDTVNSSTQKIIHFQQEKEGWKIVKEILINQDS